MKVEVENNNKNQKLIKKEWIRGIIEVIIKGLKIILIEKIKRIRRRDKEVVKVVKEIKKAGVKILKKDKWEIEKELVLKKKKVYMPKNKILRI